MDDGGERRGELPGRSVPVGDELHGPIPEPVLHLEDATAAVGHGVLDAQLETAPDEAPERRSSRSLHGQQHHGRGAHGVGDVGPVEAEVGDGSRDPTGLPVPHPEAAANRQMLGHDDGPEARADIHCSLRSRLQIFDIYAQYDRRSEYSGSPRRPWLDS